MKRWLGRESIGLSLVVLAVVVLALAWAAPNDVTLRQTSKVVYLHGALVWTALLTLTAAGVVGLAALVASLLFPSRETEGMKGGERGRALHAWALALGRTGLIFWVLYLPVSMLASQMAWNTVFLAEPRYTTAFRVLAVGVIVQVLVLLFNRPSISSALHAAQAVILWLVLLTTPSVLHPDSPIARSVPSIQFLFGLMVLACGAAALQVARLVSGVTRGARSLE